MVQLFKVWVKYEHRDSYIRAVMKKKKNHWDMNVHMDKAQQLFFGGGGEKRISSLLFPSEYFYLNFDPTLSQDYLLIYLPNWFSGTWLSAGPRER